MAADRNGNGEKLTAVLPPIRVTDELETTLMREAAIADRSLSDFVRFALTQYIFGHRTKVNESTEK